MNIKILYDNEAVKGFRCGWGFAAAVGETVLFDTGEALEPLLANMRAFGVDPAGIEKVVLSHDDWDHAGGIGIIKHCERVTVYVPERCSKKTKTSISSLNPQAVLVEVDESVEIGRGLAVTRQLGRSKPEISLLARSSKGNCLLTGCAHPGLDRIIANAKKRGDLYAVIGGFHGFKDLHLLADVPVILPCHCTEKKQDIRDRYPEKTHLITAGIEIRVGDNP
jgi:7,8-dihydropterin-6-yl-methyl-4-(beta-D-ribofuranosyl)aminobenzene 5'-phosphate synthase